MATIFNKCCVSIIFLCHFSYIICGLGAIGIALIRYLNQVNLTMSDHLIFHWLLNGIIHICAGITGFYMIYKQHGCMPSKTLDCLALISAIHTLVGFLPFLKTGWAESIKVVLKTKNPDFVVGCTGIGILSLEVLLGVTILALLLKFGADTQDFSDLNPDLRVKHQWMLVLAATLKLLFAGLTFTLSVCYKYLSKLDVGSENTDILCGVALTISGFMDLSFLYGRNQKDLNLGVAHVLSILAALFAYYASDSTAQLLFEEVMQLRRNISHLKVTDEFAKGIIQQLRWDAWMHGGILVAVIFGFITAYVMVSLYSQIPSSHQALIKKYSDADEGRNIKGFTWGDFLGCFFWRLLLCLGFVLISGSILGFAFNDWIKLPMLHAILPLGCLVLVTGILNPLNLGTEAQCVAAATCFSALFWPFITLAINLSKIEFLWSASATSVTSMAVSGSLGLALFLTAVAAFYSLFKIEPSPCAIPRFPKGILLFSTMVHFLIFCLLASQSVIYLLDEIKTPAQAYDRFSTWEQLLCLLTLFTGIVHLKTSTGCKAGVAANLNIIISGLALLETCRYSSENRYLSKTTSTDVTLVVGTNVLLGVEFLSALLATITCSYLIHHCQSVPEALRYKPRQSWAFPVPRMYQGLVNSSTATLTSSQPTIERHSRSNFPAFFQMIYAPEIYPLEEDHKHLEMATQTNLRHAFRDSLSTLM